MQIKTRKTYYEITDDTGRKRAMTNKLKRAQAYIDGCPYDENLTLTRYICDASTGAVLRMEVLYV